MKKKPKTNSDYYYVINCIDLIVYLGYANLIMYILCMCITNSYYMYFYLCMYLYLFLMYVFTPLK